MRKYIRFGSNATERISVAQLEEVQLRDGAVSAPVDAVPTRRRVRWAVAVAWVVVAVTVQMLRSSRTPLWDAMWAEDGRFFYGGARSEGLFGSLLLQLGGYLQVPVRFLSWVAALFPTSAAAAAMSFLAALTAALLSIYVYVATDRVLPRTWQRLFVAALVPFHPAAGFEVVAAVNNIHWYFMFAAFWAALSRADNGRRIALDVVVVLLAALSDPLAGVVLPLVLLRAWRHRNARFTAAALVAGLVMQYVLVVHKFGSSRPVDRSPEDMPAAYGLRVAGSFLTGDGAIAGWWDGHGLAFAFPALVVVGVGFALAVVVNDPPERRLLLILLAGSVAFFVAPYLVRGGVAGLLRHPTTLNGSRYMIIPLWLLYSALAVAVTKPLARLPELGRVSLARTVLPALAVLLVGIQFATNFAGGPRSSGASWRQGVTEARAVCLARNGTPAPPSRLPTIARPSLFNAQTVFIPVSPWGSRNFWSVRLPCDELD